MKNLYTKKLDKYKLFLLYFWHVMNEVATVGWGIYITNDIFSVGKQHLKGQRTHVKPAFKARA